MKTNCKSTSLSLCPKWPWLDKVYHGDALKLLRALPPASVDAVISDPMYGNKSITYDWGTDPAEGDPAKHWQYHQPIYDECRRVLRLGGVLAWAQGVRFHQHFADWFGPHRLWSLLRLKPKGNVVSWHVWVVQNREQEPIRFPDEDGLVLFHGWGRLAKQHPCPKPPEEPAFLIRNLTQQGEVVLDCFCGLGSTLVAAKQLGRHWIGCDLSRRYCQLAMRSLEETQPQGMDAQPRLRSSA